MVAFLGKWDRKVALIKQHLSSVPKCVEKNMRKKTIEYIVCFSSNNVELNLFE